MALEIISIHAPPRGATVWLDEEPLDWPFQFTPLREGRPTAYAHGWQRNLFQFTPLREGRQIAGTHARRFPHFNSRPSARGDASARNVPRKPLISIHAPPRGATTAKPQGLGAFQFQFTPLREGRRSLTRRKAAVPLFQFTPLREGRRQRNHKVSERFNFNSRPSARGDAFPSPAGSPSAPISIHAPPRGATPSRRTAIPLFHFNSRPSARGDALRGHRRRKRRISIHAPPRGAT